MKYICINKSSFKPCIGQKNYSARRIDQLILAAVEQVLFSNAGKVSAPDENSVSSRCQQLARLLAQVQPKIPHALSPSQKKEKPWKHDVFKVFRILVEISGIEPLTSWMPFKRSPSWAIPPCCQKPLILLDFWAIQFFDFTLRCGGAHPVACAAEWMAPPITS